MLNYQKLHYDHYYVMNEIGETTACSRAECFAPEAYLPQCAYRQRWFYDPEAGYAVRLPRNHKGDELGLRNQADLKREERYASRRAGQASIDQPYSGEDGDSDHGMDFIDKTACVEQIVSDMDTLNRLVDILNQLPIADQELLRFLVAKTPKAKVASASSQKPSPACRSMCTKTRITAASRPRSTRFSICSMMNPTPK